jgi:hypothetical protein
MAPAKQVETTPSSGEDCWRCRAVGTVVCIGASAYLTAQNFANPPASRAQRIFTFMFAGGFAALGFARAII